MLLNPVKMRLKMEERTIVTCGLLLLFLSKVNGEYSEDFENFSGALDNLANANSESLESVPGFNSNQNQSPESLTINPSKPKQSQSTYFVTATRIGIPDYPDYPQPLPYPQTLQGGGIIDDTSESPRSTEYPSESPDSSQKPQSPSPFDSQIAQPDFSPEMLQDRDQEDNQESFDAQLNSLKPPPVEDQDAVPSNMEGIVFHAMPDEIPIATINPDEYDNGMEYPEYNGQDDAELIDEPLPTPLALISSNGEGSNPPLEEEFAEAFKRVGPNGKRRRLKAGGGRRRVRMRVRKQKLTDNSTAIGNGNEDAENPNSGDITTTSGYDGVDSGFEGGENGDLTTMSSNRRRYRSTTPSPEPDPSPPTIPQAAGTVSSVVKNGPKPLIISDIHSGSTGLNSIHEPEQVEKPIPGGYTEKISTYFVTPPARISTTNAPKTEQSESPNFNSKLGDSKPLESTILGSSSSTVEVKKTPWEGSLRRRVKSTTTSPVAATAEPTAEHSEHIENSVQSPMQDRAYSMGGGGNNINQYDMSGRNNYATSTPTPLYSNEGGQSSFDAFTGVSNHNPPNIGQPNSLNQFYQNSPYNSRFVENQQNGPFNGAPGSGGSHYDRSKDPFFSSNQFFKENNPFPSSPQHPGNSGPQDVAVLGESNAQHEQGIPEDNQIQLPHFDPSGFVSTISPLNEQYYNPTQGNYEDYHNQGVLSNPMTNDYGQNAHYNSGPGGDFKSSNPDPVEVLNSDVGHPNNGPYNTQLQRPAAYDPNNVNGIHGYGEYEPTHQGPSGGSGGYVQENPSTTGGIPTSVIYSQPYTGNNGEIQQENVYPLQMSQQDLHGYGQQQQNQQQNLQQQGGNEGGLQYQQAEQGGGQNGNEKNHQQQYNSPQTGGEISSAGEYYTNAGGQQEGPKPIESTPNQSENQNSYQNAASNTPTIAPSGQQQAYGSATIESVPLNDNHIDLGDSHPQNFPIFIATSPGEGSRTPKFVSNHPNSGGRPGPGPGPPSQDGPSSGPSSGPSGPGPQNGGRPPPPFFMNNGHGPSGPPPFHGPRFGPRHPQQQPSGPHMQNPNSFNHPHFHFSPSERPHSPEFENNPSGRPPPNFQNSNSHINLPMTGLSNIPPPPSEQQAMNEVQPVDQFPPHTHSMSEKPDYEPANPPLPPGHPMENSFGPFGPAPNNHGENNHLDGPNSPFPNHFPGTSHEPPTTGSSHQNPPESHSSAPSHLPNHGQSHHGPPPPNHDQPGFDILSAYFDKPPPTVSSDFGPTSSGNIHPEFQDIHSNDLSKVPFQYSSSDGGGLDSGPYYHQGDSGSGNGNKKGPKTTNSPALTTTTKPKPQEEKNLTAMFSETPYVLMFPQLVPEEAMVPPPPKMMTKEIPVVQASSLSSMKFTPDGKPVLGPGLKAVHVHPRHQMYQVLAKAHYDKALQKYLDSRKKPPSAIYTPYGVLVPMGPSASASTNNEAYASHPNSEDYYNQLHHGGGQGEKQVLNLLLGKESPLGRFQFHKAASIKDGRLQKHFDFKANIDPALDLLAEKLAIKLSLAKYVLSAPAKLGVHAFSKHATSYSELNPVVVQSEENKGRLINMNNLNSEIKHLLQSQVAEPTKNPPKRVKGEEVDPQLKSELKKLLKERLREILDESEPHGHHHRNKDHQHHHHHNRNQHGRMMGMDSNLMKNHLPIPNFNKGNSAIGSSLQSKWSNYFPMSQPSGGLLGTIKRLFSFGGSSSSKTASQDRSDPMLPSGSTQSFGIMSHLNNQSSHSSHPFANLNGMGMGLLSSIGRMGHASPVNNMHPKGSLGYHDQSQRQARKLGYMKSQNKKVKKQLEKWLDIVLRSTSSNSDNNGASASNIVTHTVKPPSMLDKFALLGSQKALPGRKGKSLDVGTGKSLSSVSVGSMLAKAISNNINNNKNSPSSSADSPSSTVNGNGNPNPTKSATSLASSLATISKTINLNLNGGGDGVSTSHFLSSSWKPIVSNAFRSVFNYPPSPTVLKQKS